MKAERKAGRVLVVAVAALVTACQDAPPVAPTAPDVPAARSARAQDRLEALFQETSPVVMALPGTVFADNDEVAGRLVFGVEHDAAARGVRTALGRLGVDEADYAVEVTPPIRFMATLRDRFRPTRAGVQLHFGNYACTLGFNADHANGRSFVTNSHCTNTQGGVEGTTYAQPLRSTDPTVIATEAADPLYVKGGSCPAGKRCRHSDASRARYSSTVASYRGEIARTTGVNNGSLTVSSTTPFFTITSQNNSTKSFPIGKTVDKVGRTTGWTRGQVTRTCVNTSVSQSTIYLYCQTFVSNSGGATVVGSGDSGSPVFAVTSGSNVQLVGLLWGGSSDNKMFVFSPLASVRQELGSLTATK